MEYKDYYKILGVPKSATEKEIKAAFRKAARKHHPDMNKGDPKAEARFKEVNEAHKVLSDPEKRRRYDTLGADWEAYARTPPPPRSGRAGRGGRVRVDMGDYGEGDIGGFSDFFRTFFGGGAFGRPGGFGGAGVEGGSFEEMFNRARAQAPGADLEGVVDLTLEEVLRGTTRSVNVGEEGQGRRVDVKIPAGIREGSRVRVAGEGGASQGQGPRGDLYLRVHVRPHPTLERRGDDLATTVNVPLTAAVLGGQVDVPTLDGPVGVKVPPGSRPGRVLRLRGHGLPRLEAKGTRGDLLATLGVDLPTELTPREREIFEELKRLGR